MTVALSHRLPIARISERGEQLVPCARLRRAAPEPSKSGWAMSNDAVEVLLWAGGIGFSVFAGMCGVIGYLLSRDSQRRDRREERGEDEFGRTREHLSSKQAGQAETLAGVSARVDGLQSIIDKVADALERIARLEEWRSNSTRRLDDADDTGRVVVSLQEQNKTIFRRMDQTDDKIDQLAHEQADIPRRTAEMLRTMIRPVEQPRRAANG